MLTIGKVYDLPVTLNDNLDSHRIQGILRAVIDCNGQVVLIQDVHAVRRVSLHTPATLADAYGLRIGKLESKYLKFWSRCGVNLMWFCSYCVG